MILSFLGWSLLRGYVKLRATNPLGEDEFPFGARPNWWEMLVFGSVCSNKSSMQSKQCTMFHLDVPGS